MSLFIATHQHSAETCPAAPPAGDDLLSHVSSAVAARYGVSIQAEAVVDGEHCLILVLQATHRDQVEAFMAFFARFGSVVVCPASTSEAAVARAGCTGMNRPAVRV